MIRSKKILAGILSILLAVSPATVFADTADRPKQESVEDAVYFLDGEKADYNDPEYVKRMLLMEEGEESEPTQFSLRSLSGTTTVSPFTGSAYSHPSQVDSSSVVLGIDVSEWQYGIDWAKVKQAGVKYAFIRCAYTGLGSSFRIGTDKYFKQNIEGAHGQGIKIGIYYFANAKTTAEAQQEANKTLELLEPYKTWIDLPVVYDFEAFNGSYRAYGLSQAQISQNTRAYYDIVTKAGYKGMCYGSTSIIPKYFDADVLNTYDCWVAQYNTRVTYTGPMAFWQYSSSGLVPGIESNGKSIYVDCDFWYENETDYKLNGSAQNKDPEEKKEETKETEKTEETEEDDDLAPGKVDGLEMTGCTTNSIELEWDQSEDAEGYQIYRSKAYGGTYTAIDTVTDGNECTYEDTGVEESEGQQYYYKVVSFKKAGSKVYYGEASDILTANTMQTYLYKVKTTATINMRKQAGTEYAVVASVPAGKVVRLLRYTKSTSDGTWYKVKYKTAAATYKGYISGNYAQLRSYGMTKKKINMRTGASKDTKVQVKVPKETKLTVLATETDTTGRIWAYAQFKSPEGKSYKGYVQTKFYDQI